MTDAVHPGDGPDVQALEAEIVRLNKIVQALMNRVESNSGPQDSGFGLFQTTIMLQKQVRLHTEELEASLGGREDAEDAAEGSSASAAQDMQTLRRTAALQIQLLELVVQKKDVAELIDTVATLLDMPIVLFDTRGRAVCSSRSARLRGLAERLWATYRDLQNVPGRLGIVEDAVDHVMYRDIVVMDRVERVLAAVASPRQPADLAGASLSFLQQLVTLDLLRSRDELRMRRRVRRGLLRDLLAVDGAPEELRIRMQEQGFDAEGTLRVAVVEPEPAPASRGGGVAGAHVVPSGTRLLQALDTAVGKRRVPFLSVSIGATAVLLVTMPDAQASTARELLTDLRSTAAKAASSGRVVVGCSAPLTGLADAARSLQQARAACVAARRGPSSGDTAVFEDLSGHLRLLDGLDHAALEDIARRTFGPLLQHDAQHRASLYDTLHALFEHQRAVQETADALHIHRNTLQKRLAHVEQLLGIDLDDLDDVVDVQLGLRAADLLDRRLP
jgi:sugar diacid utilization regulator